MLHQQAQLTTGQQAETTRQVLWREQQADEVLTIQEDRWRLWSLEGGAANVSPLAPGCRTPWSGCGGLLPAPLVAGGWQSRCDAVATS